MILLELHKKDTDYLFSLTVMLSVKLLSSTCDKSNRHNLRIISKQYAHFQTMALTFEKFQRNRHKTVGGMHTQDT